MQLYACAACSSVSHEAKIQRSTTRSWSKKSKKSTVKSLYSKPPHARSYGTALLYKMGGTDLKSTYCFCAHMHEITKYLQFTENQQQCRSRRGPNRRADCGWDARSAWILVTGKIAQSYSYRLAIATSGARSSRADRNLACILVWHYAQSVSMAAVPR